MDGRQQKVRLALSEALGNAVTAEEITLDGDMVEEYGLDSLRAITFLVNLEDLFDMELEPDLLDRQDLRSVRRLSAHLATIAETSRATT